MDFPSLSLAEIERYLKLTGKKGATGISILGKLNPYFRAVFETEVGYENLKQDVDRIEELFFKIASETANDKDKAEFRYLRDVRMPVVIDKMSKYLKTVGLIKETLKEEKATL